MSSTEFHDDIPGRPVDGPPEEGHAATGATSAEGQTFTIDDDPYRQSGDPEADTVYFADGGDWDDIVEAQAERGDETIVVNMGPQHPSTHGVLRLILELDGETVKDARVGIGYLHTGIEKSMEYRTWSQGVTLCTRMDYLTPFFQEVSYCLGVERLLGIEEAIPEKATVMRVLLMEMNRIVNHLVAIGTTGNEMGATTMMTVGFRERDVLLDMVEMITGLRMNNGFIRPGGVANDLPAGGIAKLREMSAWLHAHLHEISDLADDNPIYRMRLDNGIGHLDMATCMALGISGPPLRATGLDWDLRKKQPYCGYETYDFDVITDDGADCYARYVVRREEMQESLKIVDQAIDRLAGMEGQRVMVDDPKIALPAQLTVGPDGQGNSNEHIRHIMGESMESLIHHFKLVTEGFQVPPGQAYVPVESPKGELGAHVVSDGGTRPYRAHFRDPSFVNLQGIPPMARGAMLSDVSVAGASLDPVMGGVDR